MKQGLAFHLPVEFSGIAQSDVKQIEFVFAKSPSSRPIKQEIYPGTVIAKEDEINVYLVPFTKEETYSFSGEIYMDTRITLASTKDNPETPIVKLEMKNTLFSKE